MTDLIAPKANVIFPNTYVENLEGQLIYMAGPGKSAPKWHEKAIESVFSQNSDLIVACPHRIYKELRGAHVFSGDETYFSRQRAWERYYLDLAARTGAIMFWLPGEENHDCFKDYGAITRFEFGQCLTGYKHNDSLRFCVGTDGGFRDFDTLYYDLQLDAPGTPIFRTLEETCAEAVRIANSR